MSQTKALVETVKTVLRQQRKTYRDIAEALELSEASIKRLFAEQSFSLQRLEKICEYLQLDFFELVKITEQNAEKISQLTYQQENELVKDLKLLLMANCLLNHWTFQEVIEIYTIEELEGIRLLAKLDRMKIITLLPGNRVKLMVARDFGWIPNGPIQQFFEASVQTEFFKSSFNGPGEFRYFVNGMISKRSNQELQRKAQRLAKEFNQLHEMDCELPADERFGTSIMIAMRPWELRIFESIRRNPLDKRYK